MLKSTCAQENLRLPDQRRLNTFEYVYSEAVCPAGEHFFYEWVSLLTEIVKRVAALPFVGHSCRLLCCENIPHRFLSYSATGTCRCSVFSSHMARQNTFYQTCFSVTGETGKKERKTTISEWQALLARVHLIRKLQVGSATIV